MKKQEHWAGNFDQHNQQDQPKDDELEGGGHEN